MVEKVAKVIVDTLESAGVKHCYGIVGDTVNVIASYIQQSGIEWVHMRHEEAGGFAAQGEAQVTGRLTAMAGSCGPGSLHFINSCYEAFRNRAPTILLATQVVRYELGFDFIQEVDFKSIYRECSVYCDMIYTPEQALRKTVQACQAALTHGGPAVLIIPADVSHAEFHDKSPFSIHAPKPVITPNDDEIEGMARLLNSGDKIVIYGGSGCEGAHAEVVALAEALKAPVVNTSRAKDFLTYDNPHSIGMTGMLGNEAGYHAILDCDTLLLLGADFAWRQFYPEKATIVQVDIVPTHLGRRHPVDFAVTGAVKPTIAALLPKIKPRASSSFYDHTMSHYRKVSTHHADQAAKPGPGGMIPGKLLTTTIDRHAAEDTVFCCDDGTPVVWALRHMTATGKRRTLGSLLHGTMASGLGTGLGVKKALPDREVIVMAGDGGFAMLMGDLLTCVQENIPVKIVVYDNTKLGFVELEQKTEGFMPLFTDLKNPDFGAVAKACGLWGAIVESVDDLDAAVQDWLAQPGPALLHVKVEPQELVMPPFTAVEPAVGMSLYGARAILHGRGEELIDMVRQNI